MFMDQKLQELLETVMEDQTLFVRKKEDRQESYTSRVQLCKIFVQLFAQTHASTRG